MEKMDLCKMVTCVAVVACVVLAVFILSKVYKCKCASEKYDQTACLNCTKVVQSKGVTVSCIEKCGIMDNQCFTNCLQNAPKVLCGNVC